MAKKVLIVDDEANIVAALEYLLQRSGYEVRSAANGEDGLREMERFAPDLVLLDVMMPQLSGFDVCQRIRERPQWQGVKIVILSAMGRDADVSKGLSLGADAYVTKPFSNAELVARIDALLAGGGAPRTA
ncbi:MAG TPA: response regulator [Burkholderiales bacterium]|nr:response regulator [Burkholderiales bacterium]